MCTLACVIHTEHFGMIHNENWDVYGLLFVYVFTFVLQGRTLWGSRGTGTSDLWSGLPT
jgi:hypothetical protein